MNVRRLFAGLIVATVVTSAMRAKAEEQITQPHLGNAEPIGSLLMEIPVVQTRMLSSRQAAALVRRLNLQAAASNEVESGTTVLTASLVENSTTETGPLLGPAVPLASLIEEPTPESSTAAKSSGLIYQHVQKTAHLLDAIGLHEQSLTVEGILLEVESQLDELESRHRDRVALAMKRAELIKLQAEISELADRIAADSEEPAVRSVNLEVPSPELLP